MSSPESTTTAAGLCALRGLPAIRLEFFFGNSNWKRPVRLAKKDVIAAIENIALSNVLIVRHEMNLLIHSNYVS